MVHIVMDEKRFTCSFHFIPIGSHCVEHYNYFMMAITLSVLASIAPLMSILIASAEFINFFTKRINASFLGNIINGIASMSRLVAQQFILML